jgi:tetratricopeptide (TPR) repeat protein
MRTAVFIVLASGLTFVALEAQGTAPDQVKEARQLIESGDVDKGLELLKSAVAAAPESFDAHLELGRALDLKGDHRAAREHFEQAIKLGSEQTRNQALSAIGISHAFESKPNDSARYYQRIFDGQMQANNRSGAAGTANALGRIYLESGDLTKAEEWYRTGYETSKQIPEQNAATRALWEMRWHHALARIAARKGQRDAALKHAADVKKLLDQGGNENQGAAYPYLLGYIALHTRQYKDAVKELEQADLEDPFVVGLLAQAHEKLGDRAKAREYYEQAFAITDHNINNAFARPLARRFLKK